MRAYGFRAEAATDIERARTLAGTKEFDLLLVGQAFPLDGGLDNLRALASQRTLPAAVVLFRVGDMKAAAAAMDDGVVDDVVSDAKSEALDLLPHVIKRVLETRRLRLAFQQVERRLTEQTRLLRGALANIDQGVSLFDANLNLVTCNDRYRQLFGYPPEITKPGIPLERIIRYNAERGEYGTTNVEETVRHRLERARPSQPHRYERVRPNGMVIEVRGAPMPGGGFIATYTDITERKTLENELKQLAMTDPLTGIGNRRHFMELSEHELRRARRYNTTLSVVMLDIDHFKAVNDKYGHAAGDEVLKAVARVCGKHLRSADVFGRLGGEEFAFMLPETDIAGAAVFAERLRAALAAAEVPTSQGLVRFTVSLGVAELSAEDQTLDSLLQRADERLYAAKQAGRNRVVAG
jgi:diguanylate cyclase (GGDEF)-like protein